MIVEELIKWCVGPFTVASVLMVFFTTKFAQHLFEIAKKLGYKKKDDKYYSFVDEALEYEESVGKLTRKDFEKWLLQGDFGVQHPKLAELLTCPGCFAMQTGLWSGVVMAAITLDWWWLPLGLLTWPSAGRILFKKI